MLNPHKGLPGPTGSGPVSSLTFPAPSPSVIALQLSGNCPFWVVSARLPGGLCAGPSLCLDALTRLGWPTFSLRSWPCVVVAFAEWAAHWATPGLCVAECPPLPYSWAPLPCPALSFAAATLVTSCYLLLCYVCCFSLPHSPRAPTGF